MATTTKINKECQICCEEFNESTRKCINCEYGDCHFKVCKMCARTNILYTTADPQCAECKRPWTQKFLVLQLNRVFLETDYKMHRKGLLLDREISKLPETMAAAEKEKRIDLENDIIKLIRDEILATRQHLKNLDDKLQKRYANIRIIRDTNGAGAGPAVVHNFIMSCPNNDCRGYLAKDYKCKLCFLQTCNKCLELIGADAGASAALHICEESNLQSAELIRKETKPCPCCGLRIYKISGCDQMWCTGCHKAFSWKTGLVDSGVVHNPHFYQYQQTAGGAAGAPRNPGDVVCGGLADLRDLRQLLNVIRPVLCSDFMSNVHTMHRMVAHITHSELPQIRTRVRTLANFENWRVQYILQKCSKDELSKHIYTNDIKRKKEMEILHIYELLSVVGIETFNAILALNTANKKIKDEINTHLQNYDKMREYCNEQFSLISMTYNQMVPQIMSTWAISSEKFNMKTQKKIDKKMAEEAAAAHCEEAVAVAVAAKEKTTGHPAPSTPPIIID